MTISATNHYNVFIPNGVNLVFGFTFRCDDVSWVSVLIDNVAVGGYTTAINADQITNPGGTVTFTVAPTGALLIALRTVPLSQLTAYDPYGRFPANSHEAALDKLTMEVQDFAEVAGRTAQYPIGSDPALQVQEWPLYDANKVWAWDAVIVGKVINVVNPAVAANVSAVAATASAAAALVSETAAAASYDSFDDRYLGPKTADPALDNDGNALLTGALYWNTTSSVFKAYTGAAWATAGAIAVPVSVAQGGTGSTNAVDARAALGAAALAGLSTQNFSANTLTAAGLITADGGQIKFPSSQQSSLDANTLDDYEEGTFTPTMGFGGAALGLTYLVQSGGYVKVGKLVHFTMHIALNTKGSSTGQCGLLGLPYTVGSLSSAAVMSDASAITYAGMMMFVVNAFTVAITAQQITTAGTRSSLTDANFSNTSVIILAGTYVASA